MKDNKEIVRRLHGTQKNVQSWPRNKTEMFNPETFEDDVTKGFNTVIKFLESEPDRHKRRQFVAEIKREYWHNFKLGKIISEFDKGQFQAIKKIEEKQY